MRCTHCAFRLLCILVPQFSASCSELFFFLLICVMACARQNVSNFISADLATQKSYFESTALQRIQRPPADRVVWGHTVGATLWVQGPLVDLGPSVDPSRSRNPPASCCGSMVLQWIQQPTGLVFHTVAQIYARLVDLGACGT